MPYIGEAAALATALLWSFTSIFFSEAGKRIGAFKVNKLRLLIAVLIYGVVLMIKTGSPVPGGIGQAALWWLCLSSLIGLVIGDSMLFKAFVVLGPRLTTLIFASSPIMATIIAWIFLDEQLGRWDLLGIAITIAGVTWVVAERRYSNDRRVHEGHPDSASFAAGILLALGGSLGQAAGLVTSKQAMLNVGEVVGPFEASYIRMLFALAAIGLIALLRRQIGATARVVKNREAMSLVFGGAMVGPFLGVWLSLVAVSLIPAGIAATLNATVPVFVIPLVVLIYKEKVSPRAIVGSLVAVGGVALLFLN